jgi:hypothetical protein
MLLAAFRLPDGTIKVTGRNHDVNALPARYRANPASVEDGFMTTDGRFLTRAEAAGIPREAPTAELDLGIEDVGDDLDSLLREALVERDEPPEEPSTIYFVGPNDPSEEQVQAWIAGLVAEQRIEESGYSLRWVELASGVRKPAIDRLVRQRGPLIFLDIDGVLRRRESPRYALEAQLLKTFEEALRAIPDAEVVISSSWREGFSLDEIRKHFSGDVAARIVGVTPNAEQAEHGRYREVLAYMIRQGQKGRPWVAIDDDPTHYPPGVNVILVDSTQGFDSAAAARLKGL